VDLKLSGPVSPEQIAKYKQVIDSFMMGVQTAANVGEG
jgi:hypothetical protein